MNHIQISVKFDEDTHNELACVAKKMRITPHKFIVTAVQEMQRMIADRGKERVPLLVVQARAALDYEQASPSLPASLSAEASDKVVMQVEGKATVPGRQGAKGDLAARHGRQVHSPTTATAAGPQARRR